MIKPEYRHDSMLSIRDYSIKQDGVDEGQLTVTIDFSCMRGTSGFIGDKYTDFLREVADIVNRWNGADDVYVTGKAVPERTTVRHEVGLSPATVALLRSFDNGAHIPKVDGIDVAAIGKAAVEMATSLTKAQITAPQDSR
jgi:hypothetical protein